MCFYSFLGSKVMSHESAAIYTARRFEMCDVVDRTLFYLVGRPVVHSDYSVMPFLVSSSLNITI